MRVWLDYCEEYDAREQFEHKQSNWYDVPLLAKAFYDYNMDKSNSDAKPVSPDEALNLIGEFYKEWYQDFVEQCPVTDDNIDALDNAQKDMWEIYEICEKNKEQIFDYIIGKSKENPFAEKKREMEKELENLLNENLQANDDYVIKPRFESSILDLNSFLNEKDKGIEFIKECLRNNPSHEDGLYYFHFNVDTDNNTIIDIGNYHADETVTAEWDFENDMDILSRLAKLNGIKPFDEYKAEHYNPYDYKDEEYVETQKEYYGNDIQSSEPKFVEHYNEEYGCAQEFVDEYKKMIFDKCDWTDVEDNDKFARDFTEVCESIYDKVCAIIKSDYCEELDLTGQKRGRS